METSSLRTIIFGLILFCIGCTDKTEKAATSTCSSGIGVAITGSVPTPEVYITSLNVHCYNSVPVKLNCGVTIVNCPSPIVIKKNDSVFVSRGVVVGK